MEPATGRIVSRRLRRPDDVPHGRDNRRVANDVVREVEFESTFEAAPAVAVAIALQMLLAITSQVEGWQTWGFSWWIWLIPIGPEALIFVIDTWRRSHRQLVQMGIRREVGVTLLALASGANAVLVFILIASLVTGDERSGAQLLLKAITVWGTNVILFGLWFWIFDRGGPGRRLEPDPPPADFLFPQLDNPALAAPGWRPHFIDYMYVSFTNSIAFSPTDTMPLSRWTKLLMLFESSLSALVVLRVAARAVNIFK
jgi:hypothetical protein